MTYFNEYFRTIRTQLGRTILAQLLDTDWESPVLKVLDGQGVSIGTHTGSRRTRNEDRVAFARVSTARGRRFGVAIVCDGVGGSERGDEAANIAIASLLEGLAASKVEASLHNLLISLVRGADEAVRSELQGRGATTLSVLLSSDNGQVVAANIGDSRIYSWRPGNELAQISVDDTIENELKQLSINHSTALDFHNLRGGLSQAIGEVGRSVDELRVNVLNMSAFRGAIVATDGAWKSDDLGFTLIALHATTAADAVKRLLSLSAWTGGVDNVSIIAIEDVRTLAKEDVRTENSGDFIPSITAWICDTKLTIKEISNEHLIKNGPDELQRSGMPRTGEKRESRKGQQRRKLKGPDNLGQGRQLDFTEEGEKTRAPLSERPKIEISIDKESNKK